MGNCCGYLRVASNNPAVSDPLTLDVIRARCEIEVKNQTPAQPPPDFSNNNSSQENIDKHTASNKEEGTLKAPHEDAIIISKADDNPGKPEQHKLEPIKDSDSSPSNSRKQKNLKPLMLGADQHRRDSRSNTSINNLKKKEVEAEKKIEIGELKLSARLIERVSKLQAFVGRRKNRECTKIFVRSMTMGGDGLSELLEMEEKEDDNDENKTKEEITKELKENKETIERNHKKLTLIQQQEEVKVRFNQAQGGGGGTNAIKKKKSGNKKKAAEEPVPGKSLLKKYRTIGDDKKKKKGKKVKFQDLVDKKKKKKVKY